ncbi:MAG TPA: DUF6175 family protein [Gillisia sp.]|nr:DUF6175 family protein [Gillisia sp.]
MKTLEKNLKTGLLVFFLSFFNTNVTSAQCNEDINIVQPSIMVLPRTNAGEDLRTIIDESPEIRVGVSRVTEYLNEKQGYQTYDFETRLKALIRDGVITNSQTKSEVKDAVLRNIPADIVMEIDLMYVEAEYGNLVRTVLEANVTSSGKNMGSKMCESRMARVNDIGKLTDLALISKMDDNTPCIDQFLEEMLDDWGRIDTGGNSLKIDFSFDKESDLDMNSIIASEKDRIKYIVEDWLKKESLNGGYKIAMTTENKLIVEDFRFAKCNPDTGQSQSTTDIERKLDQFFIRLGLPARLSNSTGSIFVHIL